MALITLSGYPSSGKSSRAQQIKAFLEQQLTSPSYHGQELRVDIISDDSLNLSRSAYNNSRSEKPARGALYAAVQRQLAFNKVVIVDSLNYIKGFRYQMYCAAREMKLRVCTIYVVATPDVCREWNSNRQDGSVYAAETLDNLIIRYEEPSSMARWDSPLFTILWTDESIPGEAIWDAVTSGNIKPPNSGTLAVTKAPTDTLHILEQTTTTMVTSILAEISASQSLNDPLMVVLTNGAKVQVALPPRNITLSELQRCKRQFVMVHKKAITLGTTEKGTLDWGEQSIAQKFSTYLEEHLKP